MARGSTYNATMRESAFEKQVVGAAQLKGWRVAHFGVALTSSGRWLTPTKYDARGFPDLVLLRDRVIYAELKDATGRPSPAQNVWAQGLAAAGCEVYLWRPADWAEIQAVLDRTSSH